MIKLNNIPMGPKLTGLFLVVGLIPLAVVGWLAIHQADEALMQKAFDQLDSVREIEKHEVEGYFKNQWENLKGLVDTVNVLRSEGLQRMDAALDAKKVRVETFFKHLRGEFNELKGDPYLLETLLKFRRDFNGNNGPKIGTPAWRLQTEKLGVRLKRFAKVHGYADLILIDPNGTVLFTTSDGMEQGRNLLENPLRRTNLGVAFFDTQAGEGAMDGTVLTDFAPYEPAKGEQSFFSIAPIEKEDSGELAGYLAIRMNTDGIHNAMKGRVGLGETGEVYLVGRTGNSTSYRSDRHIKTGKFGEKRSDAFVDKALKGQSGGEIKVGSTGDVEIIRYAPMDIPGLDWVIMSTIMAAEAFTPQLEGEQQTFFSKYIELHGFYDLFLINSEGSIFYTQSRETDYKSNLLHGVYADTHFAQLVQKVMKSGRPGIADFESYAPSDNAQSAFLAMPVLKKGEKGMVVELVVAVQLSLDHINSIVHENKGMGETGETFLLGRTEKEIGFRSDQAIGSGRAGQKVTSSMLQETFIQGYEETHTRTTPSGIIKLVSHTPIKIPGLDWVIMVTINADEVEAPINGLIRIILFTALALSLFVIMVGLMTTRGIVDRLSTLMHAANQIADGQWSARAEAPGRDEIGKLGTTFNRMAANAQDQFWLQSSLAQLGSIIQQSVTPEVLAQDLIAKLATLLTGGHGVIYIHNEATARYELLGSYGYKERKHLSSDFAEGEGLVGQCVREKQAILIADVPTDYVKINSGLGESTPRQILVVPIIFQNHVLAVVEMAVFGRFTKIQRTFMEEASTSIGLGLDNQTRRIRTEALLQESQTLSEELVAQQEELKLSNEELQEQTQALQSSEADLQEKSVVLLENQKSLEAARTELEKKAGALEKTGRYKTEFLANMSHELRSPLNSLIILAQIFAENREKNLNPNQVESARIILDSGQDLLELINDILDLSKIEAGKMELHMDRMNVTNIAHEIKEKFRPLAEAKSLKLKVKIDTDAPKEIYTDTAKVLRVIRNFLSNAIKFTEKGHVIVHFKSANANLKLADGEWCVEESGNLSIPKKLAISVLDTGIGIDSTEQKRIFEAFQQVDTGIDRRFGGTGLGLSISKELASLLNGEIRLMSQPEKGSLFTLLLPGDVDETPGDLDKISVNPSVDSFPLTPGVSPNNALADDRNDRVAGDQAILVIEDDPIFSGTVGSLIRHKGFKWLAAEDGKSGIQLAESHHPDGILLDLGLAGMDGWKILDQLKANPVTRSIPVHIISAMDRATMVEESNTIGHLSKPVTREQVEKVCDEFGDIMVSAKGSKKVLLVEDDPKARKAITRLFKLEGGQVTVAINGEEAYDYLGKESFSCMVLDMQLPGISGFELLDRVASDTTITMPPVIVHTGRELLKEEYHRLQMYTKSIVIKGKAGPKRLIEEAEHFLNTVSKGESEHKKLPTEASVFKDMNVLIVDDDMRNAFALSRTMELDGIQSVIANNGRKALEKLDEIENIGMVFMDIMMPEMDGLETIRRIRKQDRFRQLPIIVLSAKAMVEDREACMRAGANDFMAKPVNITRLFVMMQSCLKRMAANKKAA